MNKVRQREPAQKNLLTVPLLKNNTSWKVKVEIKERSDKMEIFTIISSIITIILDVIIIVTLLKLKKNDK